MKITTSGESAPAIPFPREFHIGLPGGGAIIVHRGIDNFMVMDWDRDHDAGNTVGIFDTMAVAIAAARALAAKAWGKRS